MGRIMMYGCGNSENQLAWLFEFDGDGGVVDGGVVDVWW